MRFLSNIVTILATLFIFCGVVHSITICVDNSQLTLSEILTLLASSFSPIFMGLVLLILLQILQNMQGLRVPKKAPIVITHQTPINRSPIHADKPAPIPPKAQAVPPVPHKRQDKDDLDAYNHRFFKVPGKPTEPLPEEPKKPTNVSPLQSPTHQEEHPEGSWLKPISQQKEPPSTDPQSLEYFKINE